MSHRWVSLAAVFMMVSLTSLAHADNKALAETLFLEGKAMMAEGQHEEACKRFLASHQAEPSVGALLNLARCHEKRGHLASAWGRFKEAAALAERMQQPERKTGALHYAQKLKPRLSELTIEVTLSVDGMVVKRGSELVPSGVLGIGIPVDGGDHEIVVTAPGYEAWRTTVTVAPEKDTQKVVVPALIAAPDAPPPSEQASTGLSGQAVAGIVVGSIGVASLAAGAILGAVAVSREGDLNCDATICDATEFAKVEDIKPLAHASTATIAVGAAALLAGGITFLTAPSGAPTSAGDEVAWTVVPLLSPAAWGLGVTGRF